MAASLSLVASSAAVSKVASNADRISRVEFSVSLRSKGAVNGSRLSDNTRNGMASKKWAVASSTIVSEFSPPTVSDTKDAFIKAYRRPIPSIYNAALQEILVQHHLIRYNKLYRYDPVFALGFVTVFDQLMSEYPYGAENAAIIFKAYVGALNEDPEQFRRDAAAVESWVEGLSSPEKVFEFASGESAIEKELKTISETKIHYSRFLAVGIFRILEKANNFNPVALEKLSSALGVPKAGVERDLDVYRGQLNKITQAKDLLKDYLQREKVKQANRAKDKAES